MKKKSIDNSVFFQNEDCEKKCDEINCDQAGEYYAPKSPNSSEKYVFCLKHIKLYNKRWNYFAGKSQNEIYEFQKNDFFEGKPTKPFSNGSSSKIKFEFLYVFDNEKIKYRKKRKRFENTANYSLNDQIKNSLDILNLTIDLNNDQLKRKYKTLVKKFHPDVKNNIKDKEKKMKEINKAYKIIQKFVKK